MISFCYVQKEQKKKRERERRDKCKKIQYSPFSRRDIIICHKSSRMIKSIITLFKYWIAKKIGVKNLFPCYKTSRKLTI